MKTVTIRHDTRAHWKRNVDITDDLYLCGRCGQYFPQHEMKWYQSDDAPGWMVAITCYPCIVVAQLEGEHVS